MGAGYMGLTHGYLLEYLQSVRQIYNQFGRFQFKIVGVTSFSELWENQVDVRNVRARFIIHIYFSFNSHAYNTSIWILTL